MNYAANTTPWRPGDLVLHDADAKTSRMLMLVVGYSREGLIRTRYREPSGRPGRIWENPAEVLHDPARFGVTVANERPA